MRFVLLEHTPPNSESDSQVRTMKTHFDLMVETGPENGLVTFALEQLPTTDCGAGFESLPDHRREYLDYEGPVSSNRGEVRRVAAGEYRCESDLDSFRAGEGALELSFGENSPEHAGETWRLRIVDDLMVRVS